MAFKGLLYLNLELLKCRSKVFSTSIWSCWDVNQGLLYFDLEFVEMAIQGFSTSIWSVACKKSKFGGRLLNYESFLIPLFFFFLDMWFSSVPSWFESLSRKVWLAKDSIFEKHLIFETWRFWNWHLKFWDFWTWRFWLEIRNFEKLRILKIKA